MTRDETIAFFERRQDALSRLDAATLASLHTMDGLLESPFAGGTAKGREAIEQVYRGFFAAFSPRFRQEALLIDGDRAVLLLQIDGTDHGGLMGLQPSERSFSLSLVSLCEMSNGLIAQERRIYEFTGLLIQVGAIKAKPV